MSIKGMTDRDVAFPQVGNIRKGAKKQGNGPGADLKHFRVEFDEEEKQAKETFAATYGLTPNEINILLPFNEIDRCWSAFVEGYLAGGLVYRGDGERAIYWRDPETGDVLVKDGQPFRPCVGPDGIVGHYTSQKGNPLPVIAKATGRLRVIVPELKRLCYLLMGTTSKWDVIHLSEQLGALSMLNGGRLSGIPLILRRRPKKVSTVINGKRMRVIKWLVSIEASPEWTGPKFASLQLAAMPEVLSLPAGTVIDQTPAPIRRNPASEPFEQPEVEVVDEEVSDEEEEVEGGEEQPEDGPIQNVAGRDTLATVSADVADKWRQWCILFSKRYAHYATSVGEPDFFHIRAAVVKEGYKVVTSEHFADIVNSMEARAQADLSEKQGEKP